jgi:hypothetical protein
MSKPQSGLLYGNKIIFRLLSEKKATIKPCKALKALKIIFGSRGLKYLYKQNVPEVSWAI